MHRTIRIFGTTTVIFCATGGQYQAGVAEYMAALRNPTYQMPVKTLIAAGICSEKDGRDDDARAHCERALRFQPDDVTARYRLASLLLKQGQPPQARIHVLELARQKDPRPDVLWLALRIERMLRNTEAGAAVMRTSCAVSMGNRLKPRNCLPDNTTDDGRNPEPAERCAELVGQALKSGREAAGLTAAEVGEKLKLSARQIEALENDDFAALPGNTFVRGFVRNYARLVNLDPQPLLEQLSVLRPQGAACRRRCRKSARLLR